MVTAQDVKDTIDFFLKHFRDDYKYVEVAFFGGSFTAIDEKTQVELLEAVQEYIQNKKLIALEFLRDLIALTKKF